MAKSEFENLPFAGCKRDFEREEGRERGRENEQLIYRPADFGPGARVSDADGRTGKNRPRE